MKSGDVALVFFIFKFEHIQHVSVSTVNLIMYLDLHLKSNEGQFFLIIIQTTNENIVMKTLEKYMKADKSICIDQMNQKL